MNLGLFVLVCVWTAFPTFLTVIRIIFVKFKVKVGKEGKVEKNVLHIEIDF